MLPKLAAAAALLFAAILAARSARLHHRAERFRFGCLWAEDRPGRGVPEESLFTPEGRALRRAARRSAWLAFLSAAVALGLLGA